MQGFASKKLNVVIQVLLASLMVLAAVLTATLWWSIPDVTQRFPGEADGMFEKYFVVLTVSGCMAELILWQALQVMRNIQRGKAFSQNTVRRLNVVGWECLVLATFYFVMTFFLHKFFMVVVFVAFGILGMLLFVLAQLFREAFLYKSENDMTI